MSKPLRMCAHMMPTGRTCGLPARRGQTYCHRHDPELRARRPLRSAAIKVPPLDTLAGIQTALQDVVRQIYLGQLDRRRATVVLEAVEKAFELYKASHRAPAHSSPNALIPPEL